MDLILPCITWLQHVFWQNYMQQCEWGENRIKREKKGGGGEKKSISKHAAKPFRFEFFQVMHSLVTFPTSSRPVWNQSPRGLVGEPACVDQHYVNNEVCIHPREKLCQWLWALHQRDTGVGSGSLWPQKSDRLCCHRCSYTAEALFISALKAKLRGQCGKTGAAVIPEIISLQSHLGIDRILPLQL